MNDSPQTPLDLLGQLELLKSSQPDFVSINNIMTQPKTVYLCPADVLETARVRITELETELVNVNDLRLQIADLETANQQLHHDLTASREIVALLQQDR